MSLESSQHETPNGEAVRDESKHLILPEIVRGIIDAMSAANISELEVEHHELRLVLKAGNPGPASAPVVASADGSAPSVSMPVSEDGTTHIISAPMIGTFYAAPAPGESPLVQVGDRVDEGQSIGIIEAMKIMNEIAADRAGEVIEILAENGQTVEYGSPLVRLRVDG